ncbi:MAG: hypothetical protein HND27_05220 [Bacteroidetes bacterium]|nr:hypothetical protein [Bacteroidota bacterium]MBV6462366.1 hypothetical protein [Flavobacteriales bacterium]NOG95161.1 hypothetical protein [Bacteroidota bacterium]
MTDYSIIIWADSPKTLYKISTILDIDSNYKIENNTWLYNIVGKECEYFDFMNVFMDILESKLEKLNELGIKNEQITIWMETDYEEQNNFEFSASAMKRLGNSGISFCFSIY